ESGRARPVPFAADGLFLQPLERVHSVLGQLLVGQRQRSRHRFIRVGILLRACSPTVLDIRDLVPGPALLELAQNPAVVAGIPVAVVLSFPRNDGGEMWRIEPRHASLVARIVRDAEHAYLAIAPRLGARPFDAVVQVLRLPRTARIHEARRPARAPGIHAYDGVAVGHPALGVRGLPVLVLAARP